MEINERAKALGSLQGRLEEMSRREGERRREERRTSVTTEEKAALVACTYDEALERLVDELDEWPNTYHMPGVIPQGWWWSVTLRGYYVLTNGNKNMCESGWQDARETKTMDKQQALDYLVENYEDWPILLEHVGLCPDGWTGRRGTGIYFTNGHDSITCNEWKDKADQEDKAALVDDFGVPDMVNKPPHYKIMPGVEVIDVREALLSKLPASVTKVQASHWDKSLEYLMRCWHKGGVEDLKKSRFYLDRLIKGME